MDFMDHSIRESEHQNVIMKGLTSSMKQAAADKSFRSTISPATPQTKHNKSDRIAVRPRSIMAKIPPTYVNKRLLRSSTVVKETTSAPQAQNLQDRNVSSKQKVERSKSLVSELLNLELDDKTTLNPLVGMHLHYARHYELHCQSDPVSAWFFKTASRIDVSNGNEILPE